MRFTVIRAFVAANVVAVWDKFDKMSYLCVHAYAATITSSAIRVVIRMIAILIDFFCFLSNHVAHLNPM